MRRPTALLAGLLVLAAAIPAGADEHDPAPPEYRSESTYFRCNGGDEEKVQNLYDTFSWQTTQPTRLLSDGAGCVYANSGLAGNRPTFEGQFVGNLRDLAVELHTFPTALHARALATGGIDVHVTLLVDGETVIDRTLPTVPAVVNGSPPPVAPDGNWTLTQTVRFTIDGLEDQFGQEEGFGEIVRDVALRIGTASDEELVSWAWDTAEVPAGIRFNAPTGHTPSS